MNCKNCNNPTTNTKIDALCWRCEKSWWKNLWENYKNQEVSFEQVLENMPERYENSRSKEYVTVYIPQALEDIVESHRRANSAHGEGQLVNNEE